MTLREDLESVWDALRNARQVRDKCCSSHREELLTSAATARTKLDEVDKLLNKAIWEVIAAVDAAD